MTNFRVVARNGRGAFRLRRRSRIEGRSSPKQAKNEREGRKNPGFDARQYFSRFLALLGSILEPKKVQKCSQNRSRNRGRKKKRKKVKKGELRRNCSTIGRYPGPRGKDFRMGEKQFCNRHFWILHIVLGRLHPARSSLPEGRWRIETASRRPPHPWRTTD